MSTATETTPALERATEPQHGSICHVEFMTPDLEQGKAFYAALFGWEFQPFLEKEWYFSTPGNWGPCGCMLEGPAATDGRTMLYVNVDDLAGTLERAANLGAETLQGRTEIPGGHGCFAKLRAPDGNAWGIYTRA